MPITGKKPKKSFTAVPNALLMSALSGYAQLVYIKAVSHPDTWVFTLERMRAESSLTPGKPMSISLIRKALQELRAVKLVSGHFSGRKHDQRDPLTFHREPLGDNASPLGENPLLKERVKKRSTRTSVAEIPREEAA